MTISKIKSKIRALIEDFGDNGYEVFTTSARILDQENIDSISKVYINGTETSDYNYDSTLNELEITASGYTDGDTVRVEYSYYNYSTTEIEKYIEAALVWISVKSFESRDYSVEENGIYPQPDGQDEDLLALISCIIIKPDYSSYRGPNISVNYPREMDKEQKIEHIINKFNEGLGVSAIFEIDFCEDPDTDIEI